MHGVAMYIKPSALDGGFFHFSTILLFEWNDVVNTVPNEIHAVQNDVYR